MKKKVFVLLLLVLIISFISNFYIEQKLYETFLKIKAENIKNLEHHSNKNFYKSGIENIGENLQEELIKMNIDQCKLEVRKDYFFFFQDKVIYVINDKKCLKVNIKYEPFKSILKINGFQT